MFTLSIIFTCILLLIALVVLAGGVCYLGYRIDNVWLVVLVVLVAFFVSYMILSFMFGMLDELYKLPPMPWEFGGD